MNLTKLEIFLAVARTGSVTAAAQELFVSHSTVSRAVSSLEEELGLRLFSRGNRIFGLTEEGELLLKRAPELLSLAEEIEAELRAVHKI